MSHRSHPSNDFQRQAFFEDAYEIRRYRRCPHHAKSGYYNHRNDHLSDNSLGLMYIRRHLELSLSNE